MDVTRLGGNTEKTKAIVPVHFTGYMTRMDEVMRIAAKYDLVVVEDAVNLYLVNLTTKKPGLGHQRELFPSIL